MKVVSIFLLLIISICGYSATALFINSVPLPVENLPLPLDNLIPLFDPLKKLLRTLGISVEHLVTGLKKCVDELGPEASEAVKKLLIEDAREHCQEQQKSLKSQVCNSLTLRAFAWLCGERSERPRNSDEFDLSDTGDTFPRTCWSCFEVSGSGRLWERELDVQDLAVLALSCCQTGVPFKTQVERGEQLTFQLHK
ncbi:hypothetical protein STEG23_022732 [Scotinomys teguina]